jgi:outer membrane protein OmpA-like peptidoglycan-associated protein
LKIFITISFLLTSCLISAQDPLNLIEDQKPYKIISIYFAGGRYYIDNDQRTKAIEFINSHILDNYEIHIHSHTDNIGSVDYNNWLSRMRSMATKFMLEEEGIPTENILIKDHGLFDPEFDNNDFNERLKNRRVDIVLWPLPA